MPNNSETSLQPRSPDAAMPLDQDNLQPANRRPPSELLAKFLIRLDNEIEMLDREKRLALFRKQIKAHQYFDGNFYGYVNENCEWIPRSRGEGEMWYQDNQYYPYIRTALMELSRRQTEVSITASVESETMKTVADFAQKRYNDNREKTFSAHLKQTENTYALLNGIVFRYTYFDFKTGKGDEKIPRLRSGSPDAGFEGETAALCANCATPRGEGETTCARCGASAVSEEITEPAQQIGYDTHCTGKNAWVSPNPVGIIVSMQASTIEESPFLVWKQLILRSVLEAKYPGINLPSTGTISPELRYIGDQQIAVPSDSGSATARDGILQSEQAGKELELLEHRQIWLDRAVYARTKFDVPQRMTNGKTLPAGVPLGELYPDGLYYVRTGDLITAMCGENKNDKWTASPYSLRAGSMYGAGTFTAHSDQELLNDLTALEMSNAWNNSVAREFVDPEKIPEISVDPAVPTVVQGLADGESILGRAYAQASPQALSGEVYAMGESAKGAMQNKIGAMSNGGGGLADSQKWGDTATAISIKRDLAVGRFAPDLELLADNLDRKQALQFLRNEQDFFTKEQWRKTQGDYDEQAIRGFLECDLSEDLNIGIVPGSYMPKSDSQVISRFEGYTQFRVNTAGAASPEETAYAAEIYGIPQEIAGWQADKANVGQLIERFTALSEMLIEVQGDLPVSDLTEPQVKQIADLINDNAGMPVDIYLDDHAAMIESLKDWRGTDTGRNASNVLTSAVAERLVRHQTAIAKQQMMEMQMIEEMKASMMAPQVEAQAQAEAQAATQAEAQAAQAQAAAEQSETAAQTLTVADKAADLHESEQQRTHEAAQSAADRERDIAVAAINAQKQSG